MPKPPTPPTYVDVSHKLKRIPLAEFRRSLFKRPPGTEKLRLACKCGHDFEPPWQKPLDFEYISVRSKDGAVWAPKGIHVPCPSCQAQVEIVFPDPLSAGPSITLYGDESIHTNSANRTCLYVYALIGVGDQSADYVRGVLRREKQIIWPERCPDDWVLHVWEVRSPEWRRENGIELSLNQVDDALKRVASCLGEDRDDIWLSATIAPYIKIGGEAKRLAENTVRDMTLEAAIHSCTDSLASYGTSIKFVLEAQTLAHRRNEIDYFVERVGRSLFRNLSFLYAARAQYIGLPITVPKGAYFELEIADLVAFMVRRYFQRHYANKQIDFPLEPLGDVLWSTFVGNWFGNKMAKGFPWVYFAKGPV